MAFSDEMKLRVINLGLDDPEFRAAIDKFTWENMRALIGAEAYDKWIGADE